MKQFVFVFGILLIVISCKKASQRNCLKSFGDETALEIPLDSVKEFRLYKNITYHVYQDTLRKLVVKGGKNVVPLVAAATDDYVLSIRNENKCNFLRDFDNRIIVEIHYPYYKKFYSETDDSLIFHDTITDYSLHVEQVQGGGAVQLCVKTKYLVMIASNGVGNYTVSGNAQYADLRVQTGSSGDAAKLKCGHFTIDHNSTANLSVNLDSAVASVIIRGTGNVIYTGTPDTLDIQKNGDGAVIQQ
ncbi:MAG: DUF2807 domain-containing protein [Bacteroidetes bacterium]|nr:DUF2807 domain-containing protein [Bacteroidota bacterium]